MPRRSQRKQRTNRHRPQADQPANQRNAQTKPATEGPTNGLPEDSTTSRGENHLPDEVITGADSRDVIISCVEVSKADDDEDSDFSDSDILESQHLREDDLGNGNGNSDDARCVRCRKVLTREVFTKSDEEICHRTVYCADSCKENGKMGRCHECVEMNIFRFVSQIINEVCLRKEKHFGRNLVTLDRVPSLGQASLGGSTATVLLIIERKYKDMRSAVYAKDVKGQEAVVVFAARKKSHLCCFWNQVDQLTQKTMPLQDLLRVTNFVVVIEACWTQVSPTIRAIEVEHEQSAMFIHKLR